MGVFDDKKFDGLDWISQATEPIDSKLNEILAALPDTMPIEFAYYKMIVQDRYSLDLSVGAVISYMVPRCLPGTIVSYQQQSILEKCFKFEIHADEADGLLLDFEKQEIVGGTINLVKINTTMDEDVLKNLLGSEGIESVSYMNMGGDGSLARANEVMELLGDCKDGLRTRSEYKKKKFMVMRLKTLFKKNEWNIRDTELANKVGKWIKDYIVDGNLAAFSNFCRLKVMTHKGCPIYSMEEVE